MKNYIKQGSNKRQKNWRREGKYLEDTEINRHIVLSVQNNI